MRQTQRLDGGFLENWKIEDGKYGKKMILHVDWSDKFADVLLGMNIQELVLLKLKNFGWQSLDFLATVPWLKSFKLLDFLTDNIEGIYFLPELRSIYMGDYSKRPIDFSRFPSLKECYMEFCKGRNSVTTCSDLEYLSLQHYSYKDLARLSPLKKLSTLGIAQGSLSDISAIGAMSNLRDIGLVLLRNLTDLSPLCQLDKIQNLDLTGCKKFGKLDALSGLPTLRTLNISNCADIESLSPLLACKDLEILELSQDTTIRDGDLTVLLQMPTLKYVDFENRRHYNLSREDIPAFHSEFPKR